MLYQNHAEIEEKLRILGHKQYKYSEQIDSFCAKNNVQQKTKDLWDKKRKERNALGHVIEEFDTNQNTHKIASVNNPEIIFYENQIETARAELRKEIKEIKKLLNLHE